jgi:hypothetical protein
VSTIPLRLAHPMKAEYAVRHCLEERDYGPGSEVFVSDDSARALIAAGYAAGVDPEDPAAVAQALNPEPAPAPVPVAVTPTSTESVAPTASTKGRGKP